jgi:hypothetical protein
MWTFGFLVVLGVDTNLLLISRAHDESHRCGRPRADRLGPHRRMITSADIGLTGQGPEDQWPQVRRDAYGYSRMRGTCCLIAFALPAPCAQKKAIAPYKPERELSGTWT